MLSQASGICRDMQCPPLVSVIIPTIHRPLMILRAIRSVQAQTHTHIEIIVVVDGPDVATQAALSRLHEPRLRVLHNPVPLGAGGARNAGARLASGVWLAFLDDDDEWLPRKLECQLDGADADEPVLVSCRCRVQTPRGTHIWPRRLYDPAEPVDEYLYARRSLLRGEAYLATPTFMLPATLFARSGFGDTRQHEDTTLLLRVTKKLGGRVLMRPETLVVVHADPRDSLGTSFDWQEPLGWLDGMGSWITPRAYSGYCLITLAAQAAGRGDYRAVPELLARAWRRGAPTALQLLLFATFWLVPGPVRRRLRAASRACWGSAAPGRPDRSRARRS